MRKFIKYILPSLFVAMAASMVNCSDVGDTDIEVGTGVKWQISLKSDSGTNVVSRADDTDYTLALNNSVMKIYDTDDRLIRRYEPISSAPEYIYIAEGNYYVTITAGKSLSPTDSREDITFAGKSDFSVSPQITSSISVICTMINNAITVNFDDSITDNIEEGYSVVVAPASEINETILSDTYLHKKVFSESGTTYFIQPDGETSLAWKFEGVRKMSDEVISKSGVITNIDPAECNYLTFSYEKELSVSNATVVVDTSTDDHNDIFEFSPQPTIVGFDFDIATTQLAQGGDFVFNVDGIYDLQNIDITYGDSTSSPLVDGAEATTDTGISYSILTATSGKLTISNEYFKTIGLGGDQDIEITITDVKSSKTTKNFVATTSGVSGLSKYDFWGNTATISATIVDASIDTSKTKIELRSKGATIWQSYDLTSNDGYNYTVQSTPRWSDPQTNPKDLTYYTLEEGITPDSEYECRLVIDGVARPTVTFTSDEGAQAIPYGNLDNSSLACWFTGGSSSTSWCSGNNTFTTNLCAQGSRGDAAKCAYMEATIAANTFAAGNLVFGQFVFNGIIAQTGTMKFGQPFDWTARPKSLKLRYSATVGEDSVTSPSDNVVYTHDRGRIFFAIVDWDSRHEVTSGSGDPSGVWDPESDNLLFHLFAL